jgi:hypothetical protein
VEAYKKNMFALLNKPGFEEAGKKLKKDYNKKVPADLADTNLKICVNLQNLREKEKEALDLLFFVLWGLTAI